MGVLDAYEKAQPASQIAQNLWMGGTARHETVDLPQPLLGFQPDRPYDAVLTLYAHAAPMGKRNSIWNTVRPDISICS